MGLFASSSSKATTSDEADTREFAEFKRVKEQRLAEAEAVRHNDGERLRKKRKADADEAVAHQARFQTRMRDVEKIMHYQDSSGVECVSLLREFLPTTAAVEEFVDFLVSDAGNGLHKYSNISQKKALYDCAARVMQLIEKNQAPE